MQILKFLVLAGLLAACSAKAGVEITDAWVRANAPGQSVGAAYMTLKSAEDSTFVFAETPAAGSVEIHSMSMANGVMKMRMLEELPLKAGKAEKLAPGGFHLMLLDLKKPLKAGEKVTFRLCFKDKTNKITDQTITLPIKEAN
ncbi:MAG: copper chaperone PCu(A)C [Methylotenera sp.]